MDWKIEWDERAAKELKKLDRQIQQRIVRYLQVRVVGDGKPRRTGKALKGNKTEIWSYRLGDYRILCHIEDDALVVLVLAVGNRKEIYR